MDLAVDLLNPALQAKLEHLEEAVTSLGRNLARHNVEFSDLPLGQGRILQAIKQVLAGFPDGLQAFEVQRMVEADLGRKMAKSTINCALSSNPAFERIGHGRYRISHPDG